MEETQLMQIIAQSGTAQSLCQEALSCFQQQQLETGLNKVHQAQACLKAAQKVHGELLQEFAQENSTDTNLLLIHAEDHLTAAETIYALMDNFKVIYQQLEGKK